MKNFNILADATIKEALKILNDCGEKCLLVIDNNHKLKGTLSDGDIRKAILNGKNINSSIKESYNRNIYLFFSFILSIFVAIFLVVFLNSYNVYKKGSER